MVDISIVIVNFNTKKLVLDCINSVKKYTTNINYEIIVVDNASTDGSVESLKKLKDINLIISKENGGFSKGNNLGIKKAKGKYVLLLNSDTLFLENSIKKMFDLMETRPEVGVSSCRLLNLDKTIQSNGGYFPTLFRVFTWATFLDDLPGADYFKAYHPHLNYYEKEQELDWVTGAFFLIRKSVLEKSKSLNERFFMYVEELELCFRVKKAGWKILYTPQTSIIHLGGASTTSKNTILGEFKGLRIFYSLHKNVIQVLILRVLLLKAALLRILVFGFLLRKKGAAQIYAQTLTIT